MPYYPAILGISGPSGSHKTTAAKRLALNCRALFGVLTTIIHLDDFYMPGLPREKYDHPSSINWTMVKLCLDRLRHNLDYEFFPHDKTTCHNHARSKTLHASPIIIVEGLYAMAPQLRAHYASSISIRPSFEQRRKFRTLAYTDGSDTLACIDYFTNVVDPAYVKYIRPDSAFAKYQITNIDFTPLYQDAYHFCARQIGAYNCHSAPLSPEMRNATPSIMSTQRPSGWPSNAVSVPILHGAEQVTEETEYQIICM